MPWTDPIDQGTPLFSLRKAPGGEGRAGDGDNLRPMQDAKRPAMSPVKWARKGAMEFPGVTFTAVTDRRRLSFRYEDGTLHREERIAPVDHRGYAV